MKIYHIYRPQSLPIVINQQDTQKQKCNPYKLCLFSIQEVQHAYTHPSP
jgi:hypothetical protein